MAVSPPFSIAETVPAASDIISIWPSQETPFRDTVESWLTFLSDPTTGLLKSTAFAFPLVITNAGVGTFLQLQSTDGGAGASPLIDIFRNSASPAVSDNIGQIIFTGKSSTAVTRQYADTFVTINDPVNATEDATWTFRIMVAGTQTARLTLNATGVTVGGAMSSVGVTSTADITAASADVIASNFLVGGSGIYSKTAAGTLLFRPNGKASAVGQLSLATSGDVTITGAMAASGAISGTTGSFSGAISATTGTFTGDVTVSGADVIASTVIVGAGGVFSRTSSGTMLFRPVGKASAVGQMSLTNAGNLTVAGDVTASSDKRLKKSISPLGREWASMTVREVVPVTYLHKKNDQRGIGFIAQEVRDYAPELVHEDPHGMLSLAYPNMVAILWEAVRELQEKVEALEARPHAAF